MTDSHCAPHPVYFKTITIPPSVIDENGHANNVAFVQWMQEVAVEHYTALGGPEAQKPFGTWFIREHKVEYLLPAFTGDEIEVRTWVENIRRVRSLRKYEFVRKQDGKKRSHPAEMNPWQERLGLPSVP